MDMNNADAFIGVSKPDVNNAEMIKSMADKPSFLQWQTCS